MNLLNIPWRVEPESHGAVVVDSKNMIVCAFNWDEPDELPGTIEDEKRKAEAIAGLPELLGAVEAMLASTTDQTWEEATQRLFVVYERISGVKQ